jgi:hypothetical protein
VAGRVITMAVTRATTGLAVGAIHGVALVTLSTSRKSGATRAHGEADRAMAAVRKPGQACD